MVAEWNVNVASLSDLAQEIEPQEEQKVLCWVDQVKKIRESLNL